MSRYRTCRIWISAGSSKPVWWLIASSVNVTSAVAPRSPQARTTELIVALTSAAPAPEASSISPMRSPRSRVL